MSLISISTIILETSIPTSLTTALCPDIDGDSSSVPHVGTREEPRFEMEFRWVSMERQALVLGQENNSTSTHCQNVGLSCRTEFPVLNQLISKHEGPYPHYKLHRIRTSKLPWVQLARRVGVQAAVLHSSILRKTCRDFLWKSVLILSALNW
ncbi:E3 ubiquitin-protein ligase RNF152 isoform X3 [Mauremys reevesii]|uniref:E3 ubiquitin-protein ligase RNF152 isoform X3 n=1 Tax=Mauremys reevesii TaxID=260615 RepID=UPI0019400AF7|nr:E3 ubiquitin-protein ligase RNF152 isoform X3 [Mauremys reevesii]XP_039377971.1 E3 ubiquitin-protein ligase RNF152 isoform X3 [Mauremys reevesii]XP_039377972.1 E3 ubiquitin-protein ligase RNF152 isoform X3 [Mauremys reevesii]XP_039377973.1 E3 ubiquitin-protein ligase RNF152 isoform X3 [Mauremys reevesii]